MATSVSFNGSTYSIPANREPRGWGTSLSAFLVDVANSALSKSGGNFTLTADANFGATYGLVSKYFKSVSSNIAQSGVVRFANNEGLAWRNAASGADKTLKVNASDQLVFDGDLLLQNSSGSQPSLLLSEDPDNGTNKVGIKAPASLAADYTLTLPTDDGAANQVLQTDGSGTLSWGSVASTVTTTRGDLIRRGASADERFSAVTDNRVVRGDGTDVISGQIDDPDFFTTGAAAGAAAIGIVTTSAQTLAGEKTFSSGIKLPSTGATASTLDFYAETTLTSQQWVPNGAGSTASGAFDIRVVRVGKKVTVQIESSVTGALPGGTTTLLQIGSGNMPSWARPAATLITPTFVVNNNTPSATPGVAAVLANGDLQLWRDPAQTTFTNGNNAGNYNSLLIEYLV